MDVTLSLLLIALRCILNAHILKLGYNLSSFSSHSTFITKNATVIAFAQDIIASQISHCFQYVFPSSSLSCLIFMIRYHTNGSISAYTTTSLSVAGAISQLSMNKYDQSMWNTIFNHSFYKTIAEQLADSWSEV